MLTIKKLSQSQASTYYSKDNYYTQEIGEFHGKLKDELDLDDLTHQDYIELLNGRNKGEFLTASKTKDSVPAFDLTFSASKSLSVLYEIAMKEDHKLAVKLSKIHDKAVNKALDYIEKNHIQTRIQKNKKKRVEKTGNIIAAKFQHDTSRALDPQLHTHCVLFNFTRADGKYRTLDMSNLLKKNSKIVKNLGSYYRHHLKQELIKAGIEIRITNAKENFFEIKNVKDDIIKAFSKRREIIEKEVKKLKKKYPNMTYTDLYQTATLNTRVAKKDVNRDEVRDINFKLAKKFVDPKQLLQDIFQSSSFKKEKSQEIDKKALTKIINKTTKEIKNPYHRTTDNIAMLTLNKLQNINTDIDTVINIVHEIKRKEQIKKEVKDELKELITMHDVVKHQLKASSIKTKEFTQTIVNIDKDKLEERIENARSKQFKTSDADKAYQRHFTKYRTGAASTAEIAAKLKQQYRTLDRVDVTSRAREWRGERRDELKRDEFNSVRDARANTQFISITREELRKDSKNIKEFFKNQVNVAQKEQQNVNIDRKGK